MSFQSYENTGFEPWVLPIIPRDAKLTKGSNISEDKLGKIPGQREDNGLWHGYLKWTGGSLAHQYARTILSRWENWYPVGHQTIGLQTRLFTVIDADINTALQAQIVKDLAFEIFGKTVIRGRTDSSPRIALAYRFAEGTEPITKLRQAYKIKGEKDFAVEILGRGRHYVIEGDHSSGCQYCWYNDGETERYHSMLDIPGFGAELLPKITLEQCLRFMQALAAQLAFIGAERTVGNGLKGSSFEQGETHDIGPDHPEMAPSLGELERALSLLRVTDDDFSGYDEWECISRAIKTACGGDDGFYKDVYLPWQQENLKNDEDTVRAKWDSHVDSQIGWDYVADRAAAHGFTPSVEGLFENLDAVEPIVSDAPGSGQRTPGRHGPTPKTMPVDFALHKISRRPFVLGHRFMAGTVTLGVGAPGAGKSNLAILTALAIATGKPLTGEEVHRTGRVWIHNNEDPLDELYRRIGGMLQCLGFNYADVRQNILVSSGLDERLIVACKEKDIVKQTKAVADVIAAIKEQGIVHMVIDPFVSTHLGVSENSNEEVEQVIETINHIAHQTGCSIDLVHHSLKSHSHNTETYAGDMNAARGAGSLTAAVRIVYSLAPMNDTSAKEMNILPSQAKRLVRLDHCKGNYAARDTGVRWFELQSFDVGNGDLFAAEGKPVDGDTIAVPKPWTPPALQIKASKAVERAGKLQEVRDLIASAMTSDRCPVSELLPAIQERFGVKKSTARALLLEAIPEGEGITGYADQHAYLLKIERKQPSPPGPAFVVREHQFDYKTAA